MSIAQDCLNALRQGQLHLLAERLREMQKNYINIYDEANETSRVKALGAEDFLPLAVNDLSLTDISEEDLNKLFVLVKYLDFHFIDPGYIADDRYSLTQLFAAGMHAVAAKKDKDYIQSLQEVSKDNINAIMDVNSDYYNSFNKDSNEESVQALCNKYYLGGDEERELLRQTFSQMYKANPEDAFVVSIIGEVKIKQKIEQLNSACDNYLAYLSELIKNHIKEEDAYLYSVIFEDTDKDVLVRKNETYVDEMKTIKGDAQQLYEVPGESGEGDLNVEDLKELGAKDPAFQLALDKYEAVSAMKKKLNADKLPAASRIENFRDSFQMHSTLLQTRRDNAAMTFLKVVATVLSLGIAVAVSNFWKPKSEKTAEEIEHILTPKL